MLLCEFSSSDKNLVRKFSEESKFDSEKSFVFMSSIRNATPKLITILQKAISNNNDKQTINKIQALFSKHLLEVIDEESFYTLPINSIIAIIQNSSLLFEDQQQGITKMTNIINKINKKHPNSAPLLLNICNFSKSTLEECIQIVSSFINSPICVRLGQLFEEEQHKDKERKQEANRDNKASLNEQEDKPKGFESDIFKACRDGKLTSVVYLKEKCSADVHGKDEKGFTPLHTASRAGHLAIVEYLVGHCADINEVNDEGRTLLSSATWNRHLAVVEYLCSKGAKVNVRDTQGNTAMHTASWNGDLETVRVLAKHGGDVRAKDNRGRTPLHTASWNGHLTVVEYLICNGGNINDKDDGGNTPLHSAAWNGHLEVVQHLCSNQPNINEKQNQLNTPLHSASLNCHLQVVQYLVEHGACVNDKSVDERTPFHTAAQHGHLLIVQYLSKHVANVNERDANGKTPKCLASKRGHQDVVKCLAEQMDVKSEGVVSTVTNYQYNTRHNTQLWKKQVHRSVSRFPRK